MFIIYSYIISIYALSFTWCSGGGVAPLVSLRDGHHLPQLGLGTWLGFTSKIRTTGQAQGTRVKVASREVEEAVSWAIDAGYRHVDTAHIYDTEDQVGRAVNRKISDGVVTREELFITTKLWNNNHERERVVPGLRESLKKLNLDYVDLYLIHWPVSTFSNGTLSNVDYVETWQGMLEAKQLGLTKSIGLSNFNQKQIDRILASSDEKPSVLQVEINLNLQQPELISYCRRAGIVVTGYTPFGSLFRSKAREDAPPPRDDDPALLRISHNHNKTVPQVNLRYLMDLGVVPIPKTVTKSRVEQNLDVFNFELTEDERRELKLFDKNYRTIDPTWWKGSPNYPF